MSASKMIAGYTEESFAQLLERTCKKCGMWDDVSVGHIAKSRHLPLVHLKGVEPWALRDVAKVLEVVSNPDRLPLVWHYVRENMGNVHRLSKKLGMLPAIVFAMGSQRAKLRKGTLDTETSVCRAYARQQVERQLQAHYLSEAQHRVTKLTVKGVLRGHTLTLGETDMGCLGDSVDTIDLDHQASRDDCAALADSHPMCGSTIAYTNATDSSCFCCKHVERTLGWTTYRISSAKFGGKKKRRRLL